MARHFYDRNQPHGKMSLLNMRNALRGLHQGDLRPLRPRASLVVDDFEYSTDANIQSEWSGSGCTVTRSVDKKVGDYAGQVVVDGSGDRKVTNTETINLAAYSTLKIWSRANSPVSPSDVSFYLKDSSNQASWQVSFSASDTWVSDAFTLSTPGAGSVDLSDITEFGWSDLRASTTYLFDDVKAQAGMAVAIDACLVQSFYDQVYYGTSRISFAGGASPAISAPGANQRIDLLTINTSGSLEWTFGVSDGTAAEPAFPSDKVPICLVYTRPAMVKVVDYEDNAANPNEGYIYKDVRPYVGQRQIGIPFYQSTAPSARSDGTSFTAADRGTAWVDSDTDVFSILTNHVGPVWTSTESDIIAALLAASRTFAEIITFDKYPVFTEGITPSSSWLVARNNADDSNVSVIRASRDEGDTSDVAMLPDMTRLATSAAITEDTQIVHKKGVSDLIAAQVAGTGFWHSSDAVVFNTTMTGSDTFQDLDLSTRVGTNKALVFLEVKCDSSDTYACKPKGEGGAFSVHETADGGCAGIDFAGSNHYGYVTIPTDANGVIQHSAQTSYSTFTLKILGHLK